MGPVKIGDGCQVGAGGLVQEMDLDSKLQQTVQLSISKDLNKCASDLLQRMLFLQRRAYKENPIKNKSRKRALFGLNEVKKSIKLSKCKALIVVPNIELNVPELVEKTKIILQMCREKEVKVVFALTRAKLGGFVKRGVRMSMCSIVDYSGCETEFKQMLELKDTLIREQQQQLEKEIEKEDSERRETEKLTQQGSLNVFAPSFMPGPKA